MTVKDDWATGEVFTADDQNDVATHVNAVTVAPTAVKTGAYTAAAGDMVPCNAASGGFTVTLPSAPADTSHIVVKKTDATTNTVTVARGGSDVFNISGGATTLQLTVQDQSVALQYNTAAGIWYVVSHGTPVAGLDSRYYASGAPLLDISGNTVVGFSPSAAAANYLQVANSDSGGGSVKVEAVGADAHIDLYLHPKGFGVLRLVADSGMLAVLKADGPDTNLDLFLKTKGTGIPYFRTDSDVSYLLAAHALCRQDSAYTLTSSTSVQKLFNASTNGRVTLPVGAYRFNCQYSLSSMSATSGNSAFSLAVGTAVIGTIQMLAVGADIATGSVSALSGAGAVTSAFPNPQHTGAANTAQQSLVTGTFEVTTAGTVIPSIALGTAAAASVAAGSYFECWRVGSASVTTVGAWD